MIRLSFYLLSCWVSGMMWAGAQVVSTATSPTVTFESGPVRPMLLSPDGSRLYVLNTTNHRLEIYRTSPPGPAGMQVRPLRGEAGLWLEATLFTGLEPVAMALDPIYPERLFVANLVSDTVAVVNLTERILEATIAIGDEPRDIEVAGGKLYVACSRARRVNNPALFTQNCVVVASASAPYDRQKVKGMRAHKIRALASDGQYVYVVPQNSGNHTTILTPDDAFALGLSQTTLDAFDTNFILNETLADPSFSSASLGWAIPNEGRVVMDHEYPALVTQLEDRDVQALAISDDGLQGLRTTGVATTLLAIERNPMSGDLWVAGTDARNRIRMEYNLNGTAIKNVVVVVDAQPGGAVQSVLELAPPLTPNAHAQPVAIDFYQGSAGQFAYVACLGTATVVVLDALTGAFVAEIPTGLLPSGLSVDPVRGLLYVFCKGDKSIRIHDIRAGHRLLRGPIDLSYDAEPPLVAAGRRMLYEARASSGASNGSMSCASCHIFGDTDTLGWDLGNSQGAISYYYPDLLQGELSFAGMVVADRGTPVNHPMKGPMVTQTLRGIMGHEPMHWRGDRRFFQHFRGAFEGLLGGTGVTDEEMQQFATFLETVEFAPNPYQSKDRVYAGAEDLGQQLYGMAPHAGKDYTVGQPGLKCVSCHEASFLDRSDFTGTQPFAGFDAEVQVMNPTQLRGVYEKEFKDLTGFGTHHDGITAGVRGFLDVQLLGTDVFNRLTAQERDDITAFVLAWDTGMAPMVGDQFHLNQGSSGAAAAFLDLAESLARTPEVHLDLIAKGWWMSPGGQRVPMGFVFRLDPASGKWKYLRDNGDVYGRVVLMNWAQSGDGEFTFTAVPPGLGVRLGVDEDEDGLLDAEERVLYHTSPRDPDSDRDGYSDGDEIALGGDPAVFDALLVDVTNPGIVAHSVRSAFVSTATLRVETDEPTSLQVDIAGLPPFQSAELRKVHLLLLHDLPAGSSVGYDLTVTDRNGNQTQQSDSFVTAPPHLHVADIELIKLQASPLILQARFHVEDQAGNPVAGVPVQGILAGDIGANARTFEVSTDGSGVATHTLAAYTPAGTDVVTASLTALGSLSSAHAYFVGVGGGSASFFYEQAANRVNYRTISVP